MPVLHLVCLCLGLLWLPRRVAAGGMVAALTPGLAVLLALAPAWVGQFAYPSGLWAWLPGARLPNLAAGASTWVGPGRRGQPGAHAAVGDGGARVSRQAIRVEANDISVQTSTAARRADEPPRW